MWCGVANCILNMPFRAAFCVNYPARFPMALEDSTSSKQRTVGAAAATTARIDTAAAAVSLNLFIGIPPMRDGYGLRLPGLPEVKRPAGIRIGKR